tara:strand:- start:2456 stop:2848 length:393 start_codon:yes stop_codon:yes gene_type:complete
MAKISFLDLNQNITIGVAFPLDEVNMFRGTSTEQEQLKSNLLNLLLTEPGERVYEPSFGVGLKRLLFETKINKDKLQELISTQMQRFTPQLSLLDTVVDFKEDEHILQIKIDYLFKRNNQPESIKINFKQ